MKNIMLSAITSLFKNLSPVLSFFRQRESVRATMSRVLILILLAQPMLVNAAPFVHGAEATAQRGAAKLRSLTPKIVEPKVAEAPKPIMEKAIGIDEWMAQSESKSNRTANRTTNNSANSEVSMPTPDLKNFTSPFKIFPTMAMFQSGTSLEMGATGPAGTGPSTAAQAVTLFENAVTAYAPTTTVTYTLSNQQFGPGAVQGVATNSAINFGGSGNSTADSPVGGFNLYSLMNGISGSTNAMYTACVTCAPGTSIDVATDRAISFNVITDAFINAANTNLQALNARVYVGDVTISFNRPVSNPVLQFTGMGGQGSFTNSVTVGAVTTTKSYDLGYAAEFDLVGSGVTLSKLNGNSVLNVTSNSITNTATRIGASSVGAVVNGLTRTAASGSVLATGTNITSITLKMYIRGDGGIIQSTTQFPVTTSAIWIPATADAPYEVKWAIAAGYLNTPTTTNAGSVAGDTFLMGASIQKPVTVSGTVFNDTNGLSDSLINGTGSNAGGLNAILVDSAGIVVASTAVAAAGTYSFTGTGEGNYTVRLSTTAGVQGAAAPAISLPATWVNRGEGTAAAGDGTVDGNTAITIAPGVDRTGVNFGIAQPGLSLAKANPASFTSGTAANYTLTVSNAANRPTSGTSVVVNEKLPPNIAYNSAAASTGATGASCTSSGTLAAGLDLVCTITTVAGIAGGGSAAFTLNVTPQTAASGVAGINKAAVDPAGGTPVAPGTCTATGTPAGCALAPSITPSIPPPDLTLAKSHTGNFTVGSTGTYSFTVTNGGGSASSGIITVTDTLPTGLSVNGGAVGGVTEGGTNGANWTCNSNAALPQVITCTSTTAIAVSGTSVFNFPVNVGLGTAVGTNSITNPATVSGGGETTTTNNSASDPTTILSPDLTIAKSHTGSFTRGSTGTYTLTVSNTGTASAAGTITVTDTLPTGLTVNGGAIDAITEGGTNAANWNCNSDAAAPQIITCTSTTAIATSGSSVFTFPVDVSLSATSSVTNNVSVSGGGEATANTANNTGSDPTTTVAPAVPVVVAFKSVKHTTDADSSGTITAGDTLTWTLQYANTGTVDVPAFQIADQLPSGLTITAAGAQTVTVTGSGTSATKDSAYTGATLATSMTLASGATLATQGTITVSIPVTVDTGATGTKSNQASGSGTGMPSVVSTDNAGVTADLTATVTAAPYNLTIPASSVAQTITATVDPTTLAIVGSPVVSGYKSVKLTTDTDSSGSITGGDTLTYTLQYVNTGTADATNFQINDVLLSGLTVASAGGQTVTVSGTGTSATKNASYTGAAAGAVSDLLAASATLAAGGVITITIPVNINAGVTGTKANQASASGTGLAAAVLTDNAGATANLPATVTAAPYSLTISASSVAQTIATSVDPTVVTVVAPPTTTGVPIPSTTCGNLVTGEFAGTFGSTSVARNLQVPPVSGYSYSGTGFGSLDPAAKYAVASKSSSTGLHSSAVDWDNLAGHTTGSNDDAYLAVNGSNAVGIFYTQLFSLLPNQDYQVSLWAINALLLAQSPSQQPQLGIRVIRLSDNAIVANTDTGLLPVLTAFTGPSDWRQAVVNFNSGTGANFRLEAYNISLAIGGNDFAIDDLSIAPLTNAGCPSVSAAAYKSVKLTTDVNSNAKADPGDTITWSLWYKNTGTVDILNFQITDQLPAGVTITGAGNQTITITGTTTATKSATYTGAAAGAVSNLLTANVIFKLDDLIQIDIPVTVNAGFGGILSNQAKGTSANLPAAGVFTDNVDNTSTGLPSGVTIPTGSAVQTLTPATDPTTLTIIGMPIMSLVKSVTPTGDQQPGTDLTYKIVFANTGNAAAQDIVIFDPVPNDTDFKLGSATITPATTGLTMVAEFSDDFVVATPATATWTYVPISGGGSADTGYDRNVKAVRWRVSAGTLSQTPPNHTGEVGFIVKIR